MFNIADDDRNEVEYFPLLRKYKPKLYSVYKKKNYLNSPGIYSYLSATVICDTISTGQIA